MKFGAPVPVTQWSDEMATKLVMPDPEPGDGEVSVSSSRPSGVVVEVTTHGETESLHISEHSAWKLLWKLAESSRYPFAPRVSQSTRRGLMEHGWIDLRLRAES